MPAAAQGGSSGEVVSAPDPSGPEHWEAVPGWAPVYLGLTRLRKALIVRLVIVVLATIATALGAAHGPLIFLDVALAARPVALFVTTVVIWQGLVTFSRGPARTQSRPFARAALGVFTLLLVLELTHIVLGALAVQGSEPLAAVDRLNALDWVGHLAVLVGMALFLLSLRRVAEFIGAMPDLIKIRHLLVATVALFAAILLVRILWPTLNHAGDTMAAFVVGLLLLAAAFLTGGVVQTATNIRDDVHLTTAEFAVVTVGED